MGTILKRYYDKMADEGLPSLVIETFLRYFEKVKAGETGLLSKNEIAPPEKNNVVNYAELANGNAAFLSKLAVIKLNGGLGTTM